MARAKYVRGQQKPKGDRRASGPRTRTPRRITSPEFLYAHALAIEREAARCYSALASYMSDQGNDILAELFRRLGHAEQRHLAALITKTKRMALPEVPLHEYAWLDGRAPVPEAKDFLFRKMTPRDLLRLALAAEVRAVRFFESMQTGGRNPQVRALAGTLAAEERLHVETVKYALDRLPKCRANC